MYERTYVSGPAFNMAASLRMITPATYTLRGVYPDSIPFKSAHQFETIRVGLRQSKSVASSLEFALHLLPSGTFADTLATGGPWTGQVAMATIGDSLFFAGLAVKAGTSAAKVVQVASVIENGATAGYDAYQLSKNGWNAATGGDFILRLDLAGIGAKQVHSASTPRAVAPAATKAPRE